MKATEQYFPVVLFIMLYKVVLTFESADKILKCDHTTTVQQQQQQFIKVFPYIYMVIYRFKTVQ